MGLTSRIAITFLGSKIFEFSRGCIRGFLGFGIGNRRLLWNSHILIQDSISKGFPKEIIFEWGDCSRKQMIDYENLPFSCRLCHL
jgi:hypothetical protein